MSEPLFKINITRKVASIALVLFLFFGFFRVTLNIDFRDDPFGFYLTEEVSE